MKKTFRYRIFPTHRQTTLLKQTLNICRWLYNHLLEQRKEKWESEKKGLSCYDQCNTLKQLKDNHPELKNVYSQVLQNVATRIDLAFKTFFHRVKHNEKKPGYPRFRGRFRYDSFTYPQSGFKLLDSVVQLSKIGKIKIKLHRPIEGTIRTCTIKRTRTGKWFMSFSCEIRCKSSVQTVEPAIGIDMGLESFVTLSNGEQVENPRFFRQEENKLAKAQRRFSRRTEASGKAKTRARKIVARIHERISNKRHNFSHQLTRKIIDRFNTVVVEDLSINNIQKNNFRSINKSIGDAAWQMFLELLVFKAEYAGKHCIQVNPAYTSQICSKCGTRHKLKLSDRTYHCPNCNLSLNRDVNAAINILALGLQGFGSAKETV